MTLFERNAPHGSELPVLITPQTASASLMMALPSLRAQIDAALLVAGGVLLRGFEVESIEVFQQFASAFDYPLLNYEFASTPRNALSGGIYTSTEYPAHQHIPLHNEQAYAREWPMNIWFHCVTASESGGETPIADSRNIYRRMPPTIRKRFSPGILYVRNYGEFDVPWQKVFNTESRKDVELYCQRAGIQYEWKADGELQTRQLCQAVEVHPVTKEDVWFNQAHLFHVSNLDQEVRESLEELLGSENLPRNVYYADGTPIADGIFEEIRGVLEAETVAFPWQQGDVLMLDNMLVAHGRRPFKGARKVVVAMAHPHSNRHLF